MPSNNLVISRLQNQRSRIQGMLTPGKKHRQPGASAHAPLSPVASDFAGRKFQLAAQKMRSLDADKLGQTLSGGLTSLSSKIQNKYSEIQKIIHINPRSSGREGIWSPVETPLSVESHSARQESSAEPGVMYSGSVIQKMNIVPKPGQSLDSFKEQVQSRPQLKKSPVDKKPVITQDTRRFSRVQEITPGQKFVPSDLPAAPVRSDEAQPPQIQEKETPGPATIQSQPDTSVSMTEKPVIKSRAETPLPEPSMPSKTFQTPEIPAQPVKKSSQSEMPLREKHRSSPSLTRSEQQTLPETRPSDSPGVQPAIKPQDDLDTRFPERQVEQMPQAQLPVQEKEILKALPVVKKKPVQDELKKALPVKKAQKEPQKPVARPTLKSTPEAPAASVRTAIQRQPDADVYPSVPVQPITQPPTDADLPAVALTRRSEKKPQIPALSDKKLTTLPATSHTDSSTPEMPLQQNISYRQNASHAIRAIAPDQMKPVTLPSLVIREDAPLLTRSKYRPALSEGSLPGLPTHQDSSFSPKQIQPGSSSRIPVDAMPMDPPHRTVSQAPALQNLAPIPMPLALPLAAPAPVKPSQTNEPVTSPVQSQVEQTSRTSPGVPKTNNTIQRAWEGHSPPSQKSSGKSAGDNGRSESTDLESLAENVFPYVKRILEIEANRSSNKLR
jgi:hypothetical protein